MNILVNEYLEPLVVCHESRNYQLISRVCLFSFKELLSISNSCAVEIVSKRPQVSSRCR